MEDIVKVFRKDSLLSVGFNESIIISVGNGDNTYFWQEPWACSEPLSLKFPRIFAMNDNKTAVISDVGVFENGRWTWNFNFPRPFFDWEKKIFEEFMNTINSIIPSQGICDSLIWCLSTNGLFSVTYLCRWVEDQSLGEEKWCIPAEISKWLPPKVGLLLWRAVKDKVASKENLVRRGIFGPGRRSL